MRFLALAAGEALALGAVSGRRRGLGRGLGRRRAQREQARAQQILCGPVCFCVSKPGSSQADPAVPNRSAGYRYCLEYADEPASGPAPPHIAPECGRNRGERRIHHQRSIGRRETFTFKPPAEPVLIGQPSAGDQVRPHVRVCVMTARTSFRGSFTALVTPFKNGSLDEKAFRELVDWQIAEGTNGLVPVGTTGESPTLSHEEHKKVVEWCIDQAKGRVPMVAGAGSNSTRGGDRAFAACRKGGRRRRPDRHALLQQADAGRPLPALQGDQRRDRHSDHHLQHSVALGDRHVGRHHEAAV